MSEQRTSDQLIEQIRRAHKSARPKPSDNPAWANCHHDCGLLLSEIDRLNAIVRQIGPDRLRAYKEDAGL